MQLDFYGFGERWGEKRITRNSDLQRKFWDSFHVACILPLSEVCAVLAGL